MVQSSECRNIRSDKGSNDDGQSWDAAGPELLLENRGLVVEGDHVQTEGAAALPLYL